MSMAASFGIHRLPTIFITTAFCGQESKPRAQVAAQELTARQLQEARHLTYQTWQMVETTSAADIIADKGIKKAREVFTGEQAKVYAAYEDACAYSAFVIKRRESKNITATITEARPMLEIDPAKLDTDAFLLNTSDATYDLCKGINGAREHRSEDFITKGTTVSPGTRGRDEWQNAVKLFFCDDKVFIDYVQRIVGLGAIGRVYIEAIVISHGGGQWQVHFLECRVEGAGHLKFKSILPMPAEEEKTA